MPVKKCLFYALGAHIEMAAVRKCTMMFGSVQGFTYWKTSRWFKNSQSLSTLVECSICTFHPSLVCPKV